MATQQVYEAALADHVDTARELYAAQSRIAELKIELLKALRIADEVSDLGEQGVVRTQLGMDAATLTITARAVLAKGQ